MSESTAWNDQPIDLILTQDMPQIGYSGNRQPLPHSDTEGAERVAALAALQLVHRRQRQPRAAHAERVTQRNRAAVRVHLLGVVRQSELTQAGQHLRGEGFVDLDYVQCIKSES